MRKDVQKKIVNLYYALGREIPSGKESSSFKEKDSFPEGTSLHITKAYLWKRLLLGENKGMSK